jgi:hypothetical protein
MMASIRAKREDGKVTVDTIRSALRSYYTPVEFTADPHKFRLDQVLSDFSTDFWTLHMTDKDDVIRVEPSEHEIGRRMLRYLNVDDPSSGFIRIHTSSNKAYIRSLDGVPVEFMCLLRDWLQCVQGITTTLVQAYENDEFHLPTIPTMSDQALQTFREWLTGIMLEPVLFKTFDPEYRSKSPMESGFTMFCRQMTTLFRGLQRNGSAEGGYSLRGMKDPFLSLIITSSEDLWDHKDIRLYPTNEKGVHEHARHGNDIVSYRFLYYLRQYLCWYGLTCSTPVL